MKGKENNGLQMRLVSIQEVKFTTDLRDVPEELSQDIMQLGFLLQLHPNVEDDLFSMDFGVQYREESKVILQCVYRFVFEIKRLKKYIEFGENGHIAVKHIMPHLLSVAVGTLRGILVVRTAGTSLSNFPLPIIDANKLNESLSSKEEL